MRYDNWDVILFPRDSLVPIQEFRTACYACPDEHGRQLPTLACYIASLPTAMPFRISMHSWETPTKPSVFIESRRKTGQRVVFTAQVIIDGARVFHGFYEPTSKWPQEIMNEKRSITDPHTQSSQRSPCLEFPPFHQHVLMRSSWDAREEAGRIKVLLSEQLIRKSSKPGELDLGATNDIVCFTFQHAPKHVLEQAGISWPIRNPLYLPSTIGSRGSSASHLFMPCTKSRDPMMENQRQSPVAFDRPRNPDPFARPRSDLPPPISHFPKPITTGRGLRPGIWDSSFGDSFGNPFDGMRLDSWSTKQPSSHSTADISMPDMMYTPTYGKSTDFWGTTNTQYEQEGRKSRDGSRNQKQNTRQVLVTLRDDQLGQLIEAISPSKLGQTRDFTRQLSEVGQTQAESPLAPSKLAPVEPRPSYAALARKASYQEFNRHLRTQGKLSPDQEKCLRTQAQDARQDARLPTTHPHSNRVPTPHPFAAPTVGRWGSDVSMRDPSSIFSNVEQQSLGQKDAKTSPIQAPSGEGGIKSRKEGRASAKDEYDKARHNVPTEENTAPKDFVPGHKSGMSSMDSTGRLERQLFSALGEELSFPEMHNQISEISGLDDLGTPVSKRKRQGTFGAERSRSPMAKMVREGETGTEASSAPEMPHLRGGE